MAGLPAACRSLLSVGTQGARMCWPLHQLLHSIHSYTVCSEQLTSEHAKPCQKESPSHVQNTERSCPHTKCSLVSCVLRTGLAHTGQGLKVASALSQQP